MILRQIQCFRIKRCLVRLYPQLFVGGRVSYLHYFCLFAHSGVQYISCCSFCLTSSCVPNVASFSGVSFFDCPFGILQRLFKPKQHYESERLLICVQVVQMFAMFLQDFWNYFDSMVLFCFSSYIQQCFTSCSYTNNITLQIILSDDLLTYKEEGYVLFFNFLQPNFIAKNNLPERCK